MRQLYFGGEGELVWSGEMGPGTFEPGEQKERKGSRCNQEGPNPTVIEVNDKTTIDFSDAGADPRTQPVVFYELTCGISALITALHCRMSHLFWCISKDGD